MKYYFCSRVRCTLLLSGCVFFLHLFAAAYAQDTLKHDSWWRSPTAAQRLIFDNDELPRESIAEIDDHMQASAQSLLAGRSFKLITRSDANRYTEKGRFKFVRGTRYYLVRAVRHARGGSFSVSRLGSALYVYHGTLGRTWVETRSALVVAVSGPVSEVYIAGSGAE